jgi:3-oxoacyl-[acyl-carrier protein] reductase
VDEQEQGRVVVVTGVGRVAGIGFAIARRLLDEGYRILVHSLEGAPVDELGEASGRLRSIEADLGDPGAPRQVIDAALDAFGAIDGLVVNHAHGSDQSLAEVTVEELDRAWAVNARAAVLLAQAFAASHVDDRPDGRIVLLTSGQHLGPMPGELPYVLSKGAIHQVTRTLADELAGRGITVNAVNPGPVDTGWPSAELREGLTARFPAGRWGRPDDIAPAVAWLLSADSAWVTGQVIDAEGGFRR